MSGTPASCAVCGAPAPAIWRRLRGFDLHRCPACRTAQVSPLPTPEELCRHYDVNFFTGDVTRFGYMDYVAERPYMERNYRRKLARLYPLLRAGRRTLDVGCAYGFWLDFLGPEWTRTGVEPCAEAVAYAREQLRLTVGAGGLEAPEAAAGAPYDLITLWDVLDHLRDPVGELRRLHALLAGGGLLVLNLGDLDALFARLMGDRWYILIPPTHLFYFTRRGITALLEREGFTVEQVETEGKSFFLSLCFYRLQYILPCALTRWLYRIVDRSPFARLAVYLNFGDIITVYARRR